MRKVNIVMIILSFLMLIACSSQDATMQALQRMLSDVPETLSSDYQLPTSFHDSYTTWTLDDETIENGEFIYPYTMRETNHTLTLTVAIDDKVYTVDKDVRVRQTQIVNQIHLNVEGSQTIRRENWLNTNFRLQGDDTFETEIMQARVRGRGNSTWYSVPSEFPKRPYRIRFNEDVSLLGMKPATDYVLLAELFDRSLMRNYLAHRMSQDLNLAHVLETRPIELFVNGEYQGFYTLTEQVAIQENRLDIDVSADFDGGFLIEMEADDRVDDEGYEDIHWVRVRDRNYVIKSPDMDDYSEEIVAGKINFIKDCLENVYQSLPTSDYETYVEIDDLIDYFILNEITKQIDINWSSVYAHRDKGGKLRLGPIWDFDLAFGNANYGERDGIPFESPAGFWMPDNQWYSRAISNQDFKTRYQNRFEEVLNTYFEGWLADFDYMYQALYTYANENFEKWPILDVDMWPITQNSLNANTYEKQYQLLRNYLTERQAWLSSNINRI